MESLDELHQRYRSMEHPENRLRIGERIILAVHSPMEVYVALRCPPSEVADLVQDILLAIARGLEKAPVGKLLDWCYGIARHKVADLHERQGRKSTPVQLDDEEYQRLIDASAAEEGISGNERDNLELARELLNRIKEPCRTLLWGRFGEGQPIADLAAERGMTYDATRMAIQRCLDDARDILNELLD